MADYNSTNTGAEVDDAVGVAKGAGTGLIVKTGTGAGAKRTITGTTDQVTVADGDGVAGNPTLSLPVAVTTSLGLADTAVQPGDIGTAAAEDVGFFATAAQGALADTAVQPAGVLNGATVVTGTYTSPVNEALLIRVRKSTAGTITKGQAVYIVGSTGDNLTVELALADAEATSAYTIGIAATSITDAADGFVMLGGRLDGLSNLPTATFSDGDAVYLSETVPGGLRVGIPTAPNHGVLLGFVVRASNGSAGIFDVSVSNYQELDELSDVFISGVAADDFLKRNATNTRWENIDPATVVTALGLDNVVESDPTGVTGADAITNMMSLTQAEYDAIVTPNASTFYVIVA